MKFIKGLFSFICLIAVFAAAAAAIGWLWMQHEMAKPGPSLSETVFLVEPGEGVSTVANRLQREGIIRNADLVKIQVRIDGTESAIKSGEFTLPARMSMEDVLNALVDGKAVMHKVTLPEGRTTAQLITIIEANDLLAGEMPDPLPVEGELLPDTYLFQRGMKRTDLIARIRRSQDNLLDELWPKRQAGLPVKTREEAIILASVVERETGLAAERPEIAGLFTTRLLRGMRLESDPTIIYGISRGEPLLNKSGQRRTLYRSEIDKKTEWNTYQIDGLPKTPICNPGRDAIAAVLDPPKTKNIFFVADGKGGHLFAETLAQHNKNVRAYRRYEREEIARERAGE